MAYLGNTPSETFHQATSQVFNGDGSTTAFTLEKRVNRAEEIEVFVNNIQQQPTVAYSANNTTLTFTEAPDSATGNIYVVYRMFAQQNTFNALHDFTDAVTMASTLAVTGETTLATHLNMADDSIIKFGASEDLEIGHLASSGFSRIRDTGTGDLYIEGSSAIRFRDPDGRQALTLTPTGSQELFHNNSSKFQTTSSGVTVTGGVTTTTASSIEGGVVFNESSADVDFRVESNGNANMLFVDGGNNNVVIGHTSAGGSNFAICDGANSAIQFFAEISTDTNLIQHYDQTATAYMNSEHRANSHEFKIGTSGAMNVSSNRDVQFLNSGGNVRLYWDNSAGALVSSGAGISFDAGANYLDDYEEGTWSPVWSASGSANAYAAQVGVYTKVGNMVHLSCYLALSDKGSLSGTLQIGGLPFSSENRTNLYQSAAIWINTTANGNDFDGDFHLQAYVSPNNNVINVQSLDGDGGTIAIQATDLTNTTDIMINISYRTST